MTEFTDRISSEESASDAVVRAIASIEDSTPTDLDTRLYDAVDPDALDRFFSEQAPAEGYVRFAYCGYQVSVHADGQLVLVENQ